MVGQSPELLLIALSDHREPPPGGRRDALDRVTKALPVPVSTHEQAKPLASDDAQLRAGGRAEVAASKGAPVHPVRDDAHE